MDGVRPIDGSGLSLENRIDVCGDARRPPARGGWTPLPPDCRSPGGRGTLVGEFVGTPVEGRLIAKTGSLGNPPDNVDPPRSRHWPGISRRRTAIPIEFVLILNEPDISADEATNRSGSRSAERLDTYPAGADPAALGPS